MFFFLLGTLIIIFLLSSPDFKIYVLIAVLTYILLIFLVFLSIPYLKNERDLGGTLKVYKTLPLNSNHIYLSYFITPIVLYIVLNYIPFLLLSFIFKNTFYSILVQNQIPVYRMLYFFHLVIPLISVLNIFLFVNFVVIVREKPKLFLQKILFFLYIIIFFFGKDIQMSFGLNISFESFYKWLISDSYSCYYLCLMIFVVLMLLISLFFLGLKNFRRNFYKKS